MSPASFATVISSTSRRHFTLVERKLALYDREWEREALEEAMESLRAEWERDLRPLLRQFVPCEVARERVEALLEWLSTGMM